MLKERSTYEIMDATTVGVDTNAIVLGKHSGRHALRQALEELGYQVEGQVAEHGVQALQGDRGQEEAGHRDGPRGARHRRASRRASPRYTLQWFDVEASSRRPPHATVSVLSPEGEELEGSFTGDGPVDAIFRAVNAATGLDARLREFRVEAVTGGEDALGEVSVVVEYQGQSAGGQGVATDILEAAGMAYVRAISNGVRKARIAAEQPPVTARPAELATP